MTRGGANDVLSLLEQKGKFGRQTPGQRDPFKYAVDSGSENPDEARYAKKLAYGEHAEGLISTGFHLVLEHIGAFCFGPVSIPASLAQLIARRKRVTTRNLKGRKTLNRSPFFIL